MSRRVYILALVASVSVAAILLLHHNVDKLPFGAALVSEEPVLEPLPARLLPICHEADPFDAEYGRTNLRMTRAYEGSLYRLQQFVRKALAGPEITVSVIGGSITKGHQVNKDEIWFHKFTQWLEGFVGDSVKVHEVNGAAPATGSDYFSMCFPLHIPANSDLVVVELAVNDEGLLEHIENMENLIRGLLDMPNSPAVILVEAMAFSGGGMGGGGGRMHLPVAQYYDVPVINQRHPLASHFGRYPELVAPYFSRDGWGNTDSRHMNARGHRDLGMLVASLIKDVACHMPPDNALPHSNVILSDDSELDEFLLAGQVTWPKQSRYWRMPPTGDESLGQLMPGMWSMPDEYGTMPRMRVLDGWNPDVDNITPPFHPTCLSTRAKDPRYELTPSFSFDWEHWVHPDYPDKPYMVARKPGATISFEMETEVGWIKMYFLKSKSFGLGSVKCWVDDEIDQSVTIDGWWDNGYANIGRFATIRSDLKAGRHTVTCELLEETKDPGGGHEFRLISMMRLVEGRISIHRTQLVRLISMMSV